jgi:hypothetical protein
MLDTVSRLRQFFWSCPGLHLRPFRPQNIHLRCSACYLSLEILVSDLGNGLPGADAIPHFDPQLAQMSFNFRKYINPRLGENISGGDDLLTNRPLLYR